VTKLVFSLALTGLLLTGCGYSFGTKLPDGIDTLEVPVFGNATLLRGLEFELSRALVEELKSRTAAKLVSHGADAALTGTVVDYEKVPVYEVAGEVLAGRVKVVVTYKLTKGGTEKAIRESTIPETQNFDLRTGTSEHDARREAVHAIARKIVFQLEDW
jgi:hypothetical protein